MASVGMPTKRARSRRLDSVMPVQGRLVREVQTPYLLLLWRLVWGPIKVGRQFVMLVVIRGPALTLRFFNRVWRRGVEDGTVGAVFVRG